MSDSTVKSRWSELDGARSAALERARACAKLTIPGLLPPLGHTDNEELPTPYQSLGARGVNNVSSKLLLALFPPGASCFRYNIDEDIGEQLGEQLGEIQNALAKRERKISAKIETTNARPVLSEVLKHLVVTGNALLNERNTELRMFRMDQYVILRDPEGKPIEVVIKECTDAKAIPEQTRTACEVDANSKTPVEIYTHIKWDYTAKRVEHKQFINEKEVPDSSGSRPIDKSEWIPLRWSAVPGASYGRGLVEEYIGDLRSLEGASEAIISFAAVAAKIVLLVKPNAVTSAKALNEAETGEAITGVRTDIDFLQLDKYADFKIADAVAQRLEQRLSYAFLLQMGATRNAERVTAEEIRATAQELEDILGGVYTVLGRELQLPYIKRLIASMEESQELKPLPDNTVQPMLVTGFEALGRNQSLNRLRAMLQDLSNIFGQDVVAQRTSFDSMVSRFGAAYGVEQVSDLFVNDAQYQQQQQQTAMLSLAQKAAAPVAANLTKPQGS